MTKEECKIETSKAIMEMRNHIAELEKENAELRYQLNKNPCVKTPEWYCSDCLKENAELQEQNRKLLESCEGATMMYEDLIKAKEIIRLLLHALKNKGSDYTFALENTHPVLAEAEKFLKHQGGNYGNIKRTN